MWPDTKANYWEAIPLQLAAERGHCDVVAKLVQAGSSIDQADQHGRSALFYACEGGHLDVAQLLVSAGADKDKTSNSGLSPLSAASEEGGSFPTCSILFDGSCKVHSSI